MTAFVELKDYLTEKYPTSNAKGYQQFEYYVGDERYEVTLYCNNKNAKIHAENLGLKKC